MRSPLALLAFVLTAALVALPAVAQSPVPAPAERPVLIDDSDQMDHTTPTDPAPVDEAAMVAPMPDRTDAEQRVSEIIAQNGVHVVHFWAPWCPNSIAELDAGWSGLVADHPETSFTFVTVWNNGKDGQSELDERALPERVEVLTQLDRGDSSDKSKRRKTFLDLPMTWIPTTWVFHKNGELAYAFNYGELDMAQVAKAIEQVRADWSH